MRFQDFFFFWDHRANAALRAAALRCAGVIFAASAGPPFKPPSRPSATAAGFFLDFASFAIPHPATNRYPIEGRKC